MNTIRNFRLYLKTGLTKQGRYLFEKKLKSEVNLYLNDDSRSFNHNDKINLFHFMRTINGIETPYFIEVTNLDNFYFLHLQTPSTKHDPINIFKTKGLACCEIKKNENLIYLHIGEMRVNEGSQRCGFSKDYLSLFKNIAKENNCKYIEGEVTKEDFTKSKFLLDYYNRNGFNVIKEEKGYKVVRYQTPNYSTTIKR